MRDRLVVVALLSALACSSDSKINVEIQPGMGATMGTVQGLVRDGTSNQLVAGVMVSLQGGTTVTTDATGAFSLTGAAGLGTLVASMSGYAPWREPVALSGHSLSLTVRLVPVGASQSIPPGGGMLQTGGTTITVPNGALAAPTNVSATFFDSPHLASAPGKPVWQDSAGGFHRSYGTILIDAASQPSVAFTLDVPVPSSANTSNISLYELQSDGSWGAPLAPTQVTSGTATFSVSRFGTFAVARNYAAADLDAGLVPAVVLTSEDSAGSGASTALMAADGARSFAVGDDLPSGTRIQTSATQTVRIAIPFSWLDVEADTILEYAGDIAKLIRGAMTYGSAVGSAVGGPRRPRIMTCYPDDYYGCSVAAVRGTGLRMTEATCRMPVFESTYYEVSDGQVGVTPAQGGGERVLDAGQTLTLCANCSAAHLPTCTSASGPCPEGTWVQSYSSMCPGVPTGKTTIAVSKSGSAYTVTITQDPNEQTCMKKVETYPGQYANNTLTFEAPALDQSNCSEKTLRFTGAIDLLCRNTHLTYVVTHCETCVQNGECMGCGTTDCSGKYTGDLVRQ